MYDFVFNRNNFLHSSTFLKVSIQGRYEKNMFEKKKYVVNRRRPVQCILCGANKKTALLHHFPGKYISEWCSILKIPLKDYDSRMRICIEHFDSSFIGNGFSRRTLKIGAKPIPVGAATTSVYKKPASKICCIRSCVSTNLDKVSLFRFPNDHVRKQVWMKKSHIETSSTKKEYFICGKHFEPRFFTNSKLVSKYAEPTMLLDNFKNPLNSFDNLKLLTNNAEPAMLLDDQFENPLNSFNNLGEQKLLQKKAEHTMLLDDQFENLGNLFHNPETTETSKRKRQQRDFSNFYSTKKIRPTDRQTNKPMT